MDCKLFSPAKLPLQGLKLASLHVVFALQEGLRGPQSIQWLISVALLETQWTHSIHPSILSDIMWYPIHWYPHLWSSLIMFIGWNWSNWLSQKTREGNDRCWSSGKICRSNAPSVRWSCSTSTRRASQVAFPPGWARGLQSMNWWKGKITGKAHI